MNYSLFPNFVLPSCMKNGLIGSEETTITWAHSIDPVSVWYILQLKKTLKRQLSSSRRTQYIMWPNSLCIDVILLCLLCDEDALMVGIHRRNCSAIVYIAVRIHVMFDCMNHNMGFFHWKYLMLWFMFILNIANLQRPKTWHGLLLKMRSISSTYLF